MAHLSDLPQIATVDLFPQLASELIEFLRCLEPSDWERATVLPTWRVRDITSHLVFTLLRRLSGGRDKFQRPKSRSVRRDYESLVKDITAEADEWVQAVRWISPQILISLLEQYEPMLHEYLKLLDMNAIAQTEVAWAGEIQSNVWFDIAREYTERWHHQMQIRDAFGDPDIQNPILYRPVLETFMRALPYHYRNISASRGTIVRITVVGDAGKSWYLKRTKNAWQLQLEPSETVSAFTELKQESAWKILTKFGEEEVPSSAIKIGGDAAIANHVLTMVCIMA